MKILIIRFYGLYLNLLGLFYPAKAAEKGFLLFCRPFRLPLSQKQKAFFNSAEKSTVKLEDETIQIYRWGSGHKKILFLHGWQSHTYRWKAYIDALPKDQYTIYSIDAPGHGLSTGNFLSVPLYSNLIDSFIRTQGPFHSVIGHSLGGFSLLYTLYKFPLLEINRVILLAPPGEASDFISVFERTLKLNKRTLQLVLDHFGERYDVTPEYFSTLRFAGSLKAKGLIIHDEEDDEAPYHYSIPLQKAWDKSQLISTKGFGHNLRAKIVVDHVVNFIDEPPHHRTGASHSFSLHGKN